MKSAIIELDHSPQTLPIVAPSAYTSLSFVEPNAILLILNDHIILIIKADTKTPKYISLDKKKVFTATK